MSAINGAAKVDQYFIPGFGWREFTTPSTVRWLVAHLQQFKAITSVHVIGLGDYRITELPTWETLQIEAALEDHK